MAADSTYIVGGQTYIQGAPDGLNEGGNYLTQDGYVPIPDRPDGAVPIPIVPENIAGDNPYPAAPSGPSTPTVPYDPYAMQKLNLIAALRGFMQTNGMGALLGAMEKYVRAGYTGDAIWVMVREDPEYQAAYAARFAANSERAKLGLAELSPATYIELEQGYKTVMLNRNMPRGLFDSQDDFTRLIARDVSVNEVAARLDTALEYVNFDGNSAVKQQLRDIYGMSDGEMAAYVLDPDRTLDYVQRESNRAQRRAAVGGAAVNTGIGVTAGVRDQISDVLSPTWQTAYTQATQGFTAVATEAPQYQRLAKMSGLEGTTDELATEQFGLAGAAGVTAKKKTLASQERARFAGSSGLGSTSLSAGRRAQ